MRVGVGVGFGVRIASPTVCLVHCLFPNEIQVLRRVSLRANLFFEDVSEADLLLGGEEDPACACAARSTRACGNGA